MTNKPIITALLFLFFITANAQNYAPVKGKLMTEWGEKVTPGNAWNEYPRPQLKRSEWLNVNGLWEYCILPKESAKPEIFTGNILVPFAVESSLSGVGKPVLPTEKLWYRRTLEIPKSWEHKKVILHFDAVDWESSVWLNGKLAGTHKGGSTAFSFDVTKYLKSGKLEIVLSVWDPTDNGSQPRGKQVLDPKGIWYTAVTGIWKTVWLEPVGNTSFKSVYPASDIDKGQIKLQTEIEGAHGGEEIRVRILKNNQSVVEKIFTSANDLILSIPSPKLWSPESPELYQLKLALYRNDKLLDEVDSYFAMRKISKITDNQGFQRIQLNDKTIFQYGTLDQGWWPDGLLTPPSAKAMRYDLEVLKSMGFNMLRKHIKVEPSLYYYYADSLGLLIWQDMVSGFETAKKAEQHVNWEAKEDWNRPEESAKQFEYEVKSEMDQLKFFPSIVTWVIFNEGWGQYDTKRLVDWSMAYDPSRIVNGVSGWKDRDCGNMNDAHQYPGPGMQPPESNPQRVIVLGEFGGLGYPVLNHLWNPNMRNWGYRIYNSAQELIVEYTKLMHNLYPLRHKGLSAAVYTQTTDVEGEVNGLMTYDRKLIKIDPELMRILHAPLFSSDVRKVQNIISDSQIKKQEILFSKTNPGNNWQSAPNLNLFVSEPGPLKINKAESVWSIHLFNLTDIPEGISLKILAYGDVKVYLNGHLVLNRKIIGKRHYEDFNISEFVGLLKSERNIIAIEVVGYELDGFFDYGLYCY